MKISRIVSRPSAWQLVLMGLAFAGCSDSDNKDEPTEGRANVLNSSAGQIAAFALSDAPNPDFVAARGRVEKRVSTERVQYARRYVLGAGRTPSSSDPTLMQVRVDAATALGTSIDPVKANDTTSANAALDALLAEVAKYNAAAKSCDDLPAPKNDACAYALIIIEVHRSEGVAAPTPDAGTPDSSVAPDAGPGPVPTTLFTCGNRDLTGAMMAKSRITESETWSGKVLVTGTVYVNGGTLTIAPGTEIYMDADSRLEVGYTGAVTLVAEGTPTAPIKFCGKTEGKGYWDAVVINATVTSNSTMRNVLFSDGSGTDAALHFDRDITIDNVQVRNGEKDGVWATDFAAASRALSVEGVGGNAVVLDADGAATHFPLGGSLLNNAPNEAVVRFTSITADTVFHNIGIPYVQEDDLYQRTGDVTFEAGVDYRLKADRSLSFGYGTGVEVHVNGTADKRVKFSAAQGLTAPFSSLLVDTGITSNSNFSYTDISEGGAQSKPALDLRVAVLIDNVALTGNNTGMSISSAGVAAGSKMLSITTTKGRPLTVDASAVFGLPQGGSFVRNDIDQIAITGSRLSKGGTIANLNAPYYVSETLYTDDAAITVAPGVTFVMGADAQLSIAYYGPTTFIAKGTAAQPITFLGETATPGFWTGILVDSSAKTSSVFDYVQISHAGGPAPAGAAGKPALTLGGKVPVTNSKISQSSGACIAKATADTTDYLLTNTLECTPPIAL